MAGRTRRYPRQRLRLPLFLVGLIVFQALLGMWTVTLLLKPAIVLLHLFGGLATLALLWLLYLRTRPQEAATGMPRAGPGLRRFSIIALAVLVLQIGLGGWVSTNYAALACPDFPTCQGQWWPETDFVEGFTLWRELGVDYEHGVLEGPARTAIHLGHRIGAMLALLVLGALAFLLWLRGPGVPRLMGGALAGLLALQLAIGVFTVLLHLPLWLATLHNAGAALLLLAVVTACHSLYRGGSRYSLTDPRFP
jgi:cytochrome c oxidase assembly protein subunit 15